MAPSYDVLVLGGAAAQVQLAGHDVELFDPRRPATTAAA